MPFDPLQQPCPHLATSAELQRDPTYTGCAAGPGEPCRWARRYDQLPDPAFHSERLEWAAVSPGSLSQTETAEAFRNAVLATGLV